MSGQSYFELLRHPKWQEKRLRIMERAHFECENCSADDSTLNVHHSYYEKGLKPWEYPDESLHCLCDDCHEKADELRKKINRQIGRLSSIGASLDQLLGFAYALEMEQGGSDLSIRASAYEMILGMVRVWVSLSHKETDPYVQSIIREIDDDDAINSGVLWRALDAVIKKDQERGKVSRQLTYPETSLVSSSLGRDSSE